VNVTRLGLSGDEQADRKHHGGPEMAVHLYPFEHYEAWRLDYPEQAARFAPPGLFGENLSTQGLTEGDVCIGDVFKAGNTLLQISQGRQPCWKLNVRLGIEQLAVMLQQTGRTGWYFRVLEEGSITVGDALELVERPHPEWPLSKVIHHLYVDQLDHQANKSLAHLTELAPSWRELFARRFQHQRVEDWTQRLTTPNRPLRATLSRRIRRELHTITTMVKMYCRDHHQPPIVPCLTCQKLIDYAEKRVLHCPFAWEKPTCLNCAVHCFKSDIRNQVRAVMRYAGPKMLLRHPVLAAFHFIDGRRRTPQGKSKPGPDRRR
jgi:MOSC domain-containing protein YiiM